MSVDGWMDRSVYYIFWINFGKLVLMDVWCFAIAYKSYMDESKVKDGKERRLANYILSLCSLHPSLAS